MLHRRHTYSLTFLTLLYVKTKNRPLFTVNMLFVPDLSLKPQIRQRSDTGIKMKL
jgi:hypothetical protein